MSSSLIRSSLSKFARDRTPRVGPMWSRQRQVPALPLPTVDATLTRYVDYVAPLLDSPALFNTRAIVQEFVDSPECAALQRELVAIGAENFHEREGSWVSGFWETMYLELRCAQPVNTTPYLLLAPDPARRDAVSRAANVLASLALHCRLVRSGHLPVDVERGDMPLDMRQYEMLYGVARLPVNGARDVLVRDDTARHVVVLRRNRVYALDVLDGANQPRAEADLAADLRAIVAAADAAGDAPPLPVATGLERDRWATLRGAVRATGALSAEALNVVETAIYVVALDHTRLPDLDAECAALLHGIDRSGADRRATHVRSRWWDKQQLVFGPDGSAASLLEHSPVDGHVSLSLFRLVDEQSRVAPPPPAPAQRHAAVREIKFDVDAELASALSRAEQDYVALNSAVDHVALRYDAFGTDFAKKSGVSPDALCQMAFQVAWFKAHERTDSTYESVNMKHFMGGRTETLRSVTPASALLQRLWDADEVRLQSGQVTKVTPKMKADALREACAAHVKRGGEARAGAGVDRHIWSLRQVALGKQRRLAGYEMPAFFTDASFGKLLTSVISTSNVSAPFFDLFGFGAVCNHGVGIAYNLNSDRMTFSVSSFSDQAAPLREKLVETLGEARALLEANPLASKQQQQ
jgi:carnitine O-acetyltransferase